MFISGDNFSVATCKLIAGNQEIPFRLLSRQIIEVRLPAGLPIIRDRKLSEAGVQSYEGYIDTQVATPYGVSGHLLIPVITPDHSAGHVVEMAPQVIRLNWTYVQTTKILTIPAATSVNPITFNIPNSLRSGNANGNETFLLSTTSGGNRLADMPASVVTTFNSSIAQVDAADMVKITGGGDTAGELRKSIQDFVQAQLNAGMASGGKFTFEVTVTLQRGTGNTAVLIPASGNIVIEVTLTPTTAAVPGSTETEGLVQGAALPSGIPPLPSPDAAVHVSPPTSPVPEFAPVVDYRTLGPTRPAEYSIQQPVSVPMMSSAPALRAPSELHAPVVAAPGPNSRATLFGKE